MAHAKASERRNKSRLKYLSGLAAANPEKFDAKWNIRIESWLSEVTRHAGSLRADVPSVFAVVDEARKFLAEKGVKEAALGEHNSVDMLVNACCMELSSHINHKMYRLNIVHGKRG